MPETDVIPTSASTASVGKGIRYIGKHCYAISGSVSTTTAELTLLEFMSGSGYIIGYYSPFHGGDTTQNMQFKLYFNDLVITQVSTREAYDFIPGREVNILIPPLTLVKVTAKGLESGTTDTQAIITGRVYGAE